MQSYEAADDLKAGKRDELTLNQAKPSILKDAYSDGSAACLTSIKHEINQCPMPFRLSIKLFTKERTFDALRGDSEYACCIVD